MILINGCSFTAGYGCPVRWSDSIVSGINIAQDGASNDLILRSTVEFIQTNRVNHAIIAWTMPDRIEIGGLQLNANSYRKYGELSNRVFQDWDDAWAYKKFLAQARLLDAYLTNQSIPHVFITAFGMPPFAKAEDLDLACYLGWPDVNLLNIASGCAFGDHGHPLEQAHETIAKYINEHIRTLGWIS